MERRRPGQPGKDYARPKSGRALVVVEPVGTLRFGEELTYRRGLCLRRGHHYLRRGSKFRCLTCAQTARWLVSQL